MENSKELKVFDLAEQTAQNIIEIGKTMLEVKNNIPYGDFQNWLENHVHYSRRTAYNFMKVAEEFKDVQPIAHLGIKKLLALTGLEPEERENIINDYDLEKMTVKQVEEVVKMEKQLESIQFLMKILSTEVTKTGIDYNSTPNMHWDIDVITGEKLTLEEVKELQQGVEELFVDDINRTRIYWHKHIDTLKKNSNDDKNFIQKFYEENIMEKIQGNMNGDEYSKCSYLYWNIMLIEYFKNKGVEL